MGSVLYLDRGMRGRRNGAAAAAPAVRETHAPSLLRPGYNCWAVSRAERVALLVDAADYFKAFYEAALRARQSITILGWDFNSQTRLHFDPVEPNGPPALLGEFLNYLVARRHSLHVHVLNWDYPMVFGTDREFPPLYGFGWTPARRVHLRYDDTHPVAGSPAMTMTRGPPRSRPSCRASRWASHAPHRRAASCRRSRRWRSSTST